MSAPLNILFATPECAPVVKTGGLGDVSAALPHALRELGLDARVLLPGYPSVLAAAGDAPDAGTLEVFGHSVRILDARLQSGVPMLVVDCPKLFARGGGPYQADDGEDGRRVHLTCYSLCHGMPALSYRTRGSCASLIYSKRKVCQW